MAIARNTWKQATTEARHRQKASTLNHLIPRMCQPWGPPQEIGGTIAWNASLWDRFISAARIEDEIDIARRAVGQVMWKYCHIPTLSSCSERKNRLSSQGHVIFRCDAHQGSRQPRLGCEAATGRRDRRLPCPVPHADGRVAARGPHLWQAAPPSLGTLRIARDIADPRALLVDLPGLPDHTPPPCWPRPFGGTAGHPVAHCGARGSALLDGTPPLALAQRGHAGPVTVCHQRRTGGQAAFLEAARPGGHGVARRHGLGQGGGL